MKSVIGRNAMMNRSVKLMRLLQNLNNRKGISLIEVIVALVIFVIGILAMVRMFPGGFFTVMHSENITLADRLAQAEIERWRSRATNLPSGILPWGDDEQTGMRVVLPFADPENLRGSVAPGGPYFSDINKFRRIHAEATKIPVPSHEGWGFGSVYIVGFGPIDTRDTVLVYSGPMVRRQLPRNIHDLRVNSHSEYAVAHTRNEYDGEGAVIYVRPANYYRQFIMHYSYWLDDGGSPELHSVLSQLIEVPALLDQNVPYQAVDIPDPYDPGRLLRDTPGFMALERGSDSLHRGFIYLDEGTGFSADPYEFKFVDNPDRPTRGALIFNPNGYNREEVTARGTVPFTAYIDYTTLDWHIISEERRVPGGSGDPYVNVKLTLRFLKEAGETQEFDGTTYMGLAPDVGITEDILVVDLENGFVYTIGSPSYDPNYPAFTVDYRNGIIRFHESLIGRAFRIYYKADGDWGLHTYKAFDVYRRTWHHRPGEREFYVEMSPGQNYGLIYFTRCYAKNTVAVDLRYSIDGSEEIRTIRGKSFQISEQSDIVQGGNPDERISWIDPMPILSDLYPGSTIQIRDVTAVYGVSVSTRVVWRETGRAFRAGSWKQKKLETYLTRASE